MPEENKESENIESKQATLEDRIVEMDKEALLAKETVTVSDPVKENQAEKTILLDTPKASEPDGNVILPGVVVGSNEKKRSNKTLIAGLLGLIIGMLVTYYSIHGTLPGFNTTAVAVVNGTEISQIEFDEVYSQVVASAGQSGQDVTDSLITDLLKEQTLDILITNKILEEEAISGGFSATAEEIDTEYDFVVLQAGGAELVQQIFDETGLTEERLKEDIGTKIIVDAYLGSVIDESSYAVTSEEVDEALSAINLEGAEGVSLDDIRPQVEAQLQSNKQQEAIQAHIEELKAQSEIKILL